MDNDGDDNDDDDDGDAYNDDDDDDNDFCFRGMRQGEQSLRLDLRMASQTIPTNTESATLQHLCCAL